MADLNDTQPANQLYLEDFTVGQRFLSDTYAITAQQIKDFAGEFDPQYFHLDEEKAKDSLFGGLAASGWHTASISMRLIVSSQRIAGGSVGLGGEISWPRPTRPGDLLQVAGEVMEIIPSKSRPERGIVVFRNETRNQHGQVVQVMVAKVMVPRRPAGVV